MLNNIIYCRNKYTTKAIKDYQIKCKGSKTLYRFAALGKSYVLAYHLVFHWG